MSQAASSELRVAVTCNRKQFLTKGESERILAGIQRQIISDARSPQQDKNRPAFIAQPLFEDGVIKLWCANDHTLTWLKKTVSKLSVTSSNLVVKSQLEIQKRTLGIFVIPDKQEVFKGPADIMSTLTYQNPFIDCHRLEIISASQDLFRQKWHVQMMFPEDLKRILKSAGCSLSIGLTAVTVEFDN